MGKNEALEIRSGVAPSVKADFHTHPHIKNDAAGHTPTECDLW